MSKTNPKPADTLRELVRGRAAEDVSMMFAVLKGDHARSLGAAVTSLMHAMPEYGIPERVALLVEIAERFEELVREGHNATQALRQMRAEGLLERYKLPITIQREMH